jgi:hypothetical protein
MRLLVGKKMFRESCPLKQNQYSKDNMKIFTDWFSGWRNNQEAKKRSKQLALAPKDLAEAIARLDKLMPDDVKDMFKKEPEDHPGSQYHFNAGMALRNNWGLWVDDQPLTQWFRQRGIWHADDMSSIIFKAYWCYLNNKEFSIEAEADYYTKWWAKNNTGFDGKSLTE